MIAAIGGIIYLMYALIYLDLQSIILYFVFGFIVFTVPFFVNAFTIEEISITENEIKYKNILSKKEYFVKLDDISHFSYYNEPVERIKYLPFLEIYIKTKYKNFNRMRLDLCLSKQDRYSLLSKLHRKGFQVTLFDSLRQIQDTEYYVEERK